ncbi:T9SS type B sorting domain-containing protein [Sediminibacterium roseum]|uniref:T9SS type B sorting domain-containing protein n=1 Tax=Sediminibacterium roseum TaxID=1978412 RepID=A0ABW9ZZ47_9BACT|nr:gliding motility-associated C-terminal domain-containing protein [Sediminibacterium roseum]NCI51529.1 T9SS type B sorting domain-containing protein [Sediminibacterium roseum]
MKRIIFLLLILFSAAYSFAGHIAGGEVFYKYIGPGGTANTSRYEISLRLFRECDPDPPAPGTMTADMPASVIVNIYNNSSPSTLYELGINVTRASFNTIQLGTLNPCISPAPPKPICYQVGVFTFTRDLPNSAAGYTVTFQTCCRTVNIVNVYSNPAQNEGATYTGNIPGTTALPVGVNSSPVFALKDTTLVCAGGKFILDFGANDPDAGDSLSYSLCSAFDRGLTINSAATSNYSYPPYNNVAYNAGYTGSTPLGDLAVIDPVTGIISGIAPGTPGRYVVTVCITEWRAGKIISNHRKDFTLRVNSCTLTGAVLKPTYISCTGTTLFFENESTSSNINSYLWDFGVAGITTDTSTNPTPSYDYLKSGKDSGTFTVKLKVATVNGCEDSTTALVKVYPGFKTGFTVTGSCLLNNYIFKDTSTIKYGTVTSRLWNFGDVSTLADTARAKDTAWKYTSPGTVQLQLVVANNIGCIDTITRPFTILDRPSLSLPFKDTLICSIDTLMLRSNITSGSVVWSPAGTGPNATRILNRNTATPLVYPTDTTKYYVTVSDNGCTNTDSVTVNVLPFIAVKAGLDTGVCQTDTFRLRPVSHALQYLWTASTGENVEDVKYPLVQPLVSTRYYVTANLGKCQAVDSMFVTVSPYPLAAAGNDVTICYGSRVQLNGSSNATKYSWTPASSLINPNTLNPIAGPTKTTMYILSATNTAGCLNAKTDTVIVTVTPPIIANAGRDTAVVAGQPLQLEATGGTTYLWSPATGLSAINIANPIATLDKTYDTMVYTVRVSIGACYAEDQVKVRVYKSAPDILVPSGFTPNGDGKNDVSRPVLLGISKLNYFSIYNRWGQLVFTTSEQNKGWDGNFNGSPQPSGTYVYITSGVDFLGNVISRKGTVVLIR